MKKLIAIVIVATMIAALTACATDGSGTGSENNYSSAQSPLGGNGSVSPSADGGGNGESASVSADQGGGNGSEDGGTSASSGGDNAEAQTWETFTRAEKLNAAFSDEDLTISDGEFVNFFKNLGEYDFNETVRPNAKYASPSATSSGDGSKEKPYRLADAFYELSAGDTLYLRGGTYTLTDSDGASLEASGTAKKPVTIRNYPGENVVITSSYVGKEACAVQFDAKVSYLVFEGIEIKGITSKTAIGIAVYDGGQNHVVIRNCKIHDIKTNSKNPESDGDAGANGILLLGENASKPISNFIIAENEIYDNVNGWSENISSAGNCEYIYVFGNSVHNNTNIGIDFYGNAGYCSAKQYDQPRYCLAAFNVVDTSVCGYADCAALYADGARDTVFAYNVVKNSQFGIEVGSEERVDDYPVKNIVVKYNSVKNNSVVGIRVGGYEENATGVVKSCKFVGNVLYNNASADSAEIVVAKVDGITFDKNSIYAVKGVPVSTDFDENYIKNVSFVNNVFYKEGASDAEVEFYIFKKSVVSMAAFNLKFGTNEYKKFTV